MTDFTVFYTVSLRGELRVLPYLQTLIAQERARNNGPALLVDLGESCRADWPICRATEGRAALVALDGMGYDAFFLSQEEPLTRDANTLGKLRDTVLTAVLLPGEAVTLRKKIGEEQYVNVCVVGGEHEPQDESDADLTLLLSRGLPLASRVTETGAVVIEDRREARIPELGRVDIRVTESDDGRIVEITAQARIAIPAGIRPDASILSVVEFVESEAAQAARRR